jgi:hypothetical protein
MDFSAQEEFSYAYIHAVAAGAGYSFQSATRQLDLAGIDATIHAVGKNGTFKARPCPLYLQVKSSYRNLLQSDHVCYDLAVTDYNALIDDEFQTNPFILIVVLVPKERNEWLAHSEKELCLKHCAYWLSLRGNEPKTGSAKTVRVKIPRSQQLTVNSLQGIMLRISQGGAP